MKFGMIYRFSMCCIKLIYKIFILYAPCVCHNTERKFKQTVVWQIGKRQIRQTAQI